MRLLIALIQFLVYFTFCNCLLNYHVKYYTKLKQVENDDNYDTLFDNNILQNQLPLNNIETNKKDAKKTISNKRLSIFQGLTRWENINRALIAGVFVAGIGAGITIDSAINTNPKDLASRDAIDRNAPNPKLCANYGSSAMVLDERIFVTFNPFNIYVTQADTKPGCVLRPSNVVPLLQNERHLLSDEEIEGCKNGFNTWAYVGDINNKPQLTCVFQSDEAQNEFLSNPKVGLGEDVYDDDSDKNINNSNDPIALIDSPQLNGKNVKKNKK